MKKYLNYTYLGLVLILLVCNSCEDYLSEFPDNRTQIDTPEKIAELLVAAYPEACYMNMAETMSDNVGDKNSRPSELNEVMYNWETTDVDDLDYPLGYWNACYKAIAQANQALFSIEELGDLSNTKAQKGEALLARAYAHFMLVNLWAKHYNPNTANSDLGIPYVLKPETEFLVDYKRNSVQEVYDLIEKDLLEGLKFVTNDYEQPKFHFTPQAANAFASRFYLFKGEWDKVIEYSSKVLGANPAQQLRDYLNVYRNLEYSERTALYASGDDPANLLVVSANSIYARRFAGNAYGLNAEISNNLFSERNILNKNWVYQLFGTDRTFNLPKYEELFIVTNQSAGIGNPYVGLVLFSIDEVLLNRAEAFAMKNQFDSSLLDIDTFLSARTLGYIPTTDMLTRGMITAAYPVIEDEFKPYYERTFSNEQRSFVKAILEIKRREFYHEGLRWFDVRRFNIRVTHSFADNTTPDTVLEQDDNRRQLQIPQAAIALGVERNPR